MTIGALAAGFLGDAFGRRFTYQANLLVFGLASFAAVLAPTMPWLVTARFLMGLGLGAEIVVGYSTLAEFVPPRLAGPVALLHGVGRGIRTAGNSAPRFNNHSYLRLAASFLDFRYRRSHRLVFAKIYARIAALAGVKAPLRRSRGTYNNRSNVNPPTLTCGPFRRKRPP
jgi:MFS family permease